MSLANEKSTVLFKMWLLEKHELSMAFLLGSIGPENLDFIRQATESLRRVLNRCGPLPMKILLVLSGVR